MFNPFTRAPRGGAAWFNAGPVSSFPSISASNAGPLAQQRKCNDTFAPGCKAFYVPAEDASAARQVGIDEWEEEGAGGKKEQVMVFRFEGGFVAVDHVGEPVLFLFLTLHLLLSFWALLVLPLSFEKPRSAASWASAQHHLHAFPDQL